MSGSDSAGVNAMVPGRKCEPRTQRKLPILFGRSWPIVACRLGWKKSRLTSSDLSWVSSFLVKNQFLHDCFANGPLDSPGASWA